MITPPSEGDSPIDDGVMASRPTTRSQSAVANASTETGETPVRSQQSHEQQQVDPDAAILEVIRFLEGEVARRERQRKLEALQRRLAALEQSGDVETQSP